MPLPRGFVQCIGHRPENRGKRRFSHTRWVDFILHKMHVDFFWRFFHPDHLILVEIVFLRNSVLKSQFPKKSVTDTIGYRPLCHVCGRIGIYHYSTINCTNYFFHHRFAILHLKIQHMRCIGVMTKIGGSRGPAFNLRANLFSVICLLW